MTCHCNDEMASAIFDQLCPRSPARGRSKCSPAGRQWGEERLHHRGRGEDSGWVRPPSSTNPHPLPTHHPPSNNNRGETRTRADRKLGWLPIQCRDGSAILLPLTSFLTFHISIIPLILGHYHDYCLIYPKKEWVYILKMQHVKFQLL